MTRLILHMSQMWSLIRKEVQARVKDPANRPRLFAPAIMQALLFGYGAIHAAYAVLDKSRGAA